MASAARLYQIRNRFDSFASAEKLNLLGALEREQIRSANELKRLHTALCFIRAFPDSTAHHRLATTELKAFEARVNSCGQSTQHQLRDTGIAGTLLHYSFSYEVAAWLARRTAGSVSIDWEDTHDPPGLDEVLTHLLHAAEDEHFDSGEVSARDWIEQASAAATGTDFDWLIAQLGDKRYASFWAQLYDAADLWLTWDLRRSRFSKSQNAYPVKRVLTREDGMRRPAGSVKQQIMQPIEDVSRLSARAGRKMIDVAMASLAARHRETFHFNHANANEVYVADVGLGVGIAVFGLDVEHRFPLECTMGYLILSNGMPVGYGGSSIVFRQVNTGVNIFDEYRGSEAAFLWVQVMRTYHGLTGCNRFIANPYQFGADNTEALKSGAFWFYYRLGFRPTELEVRLLARQESHHRRHDHGYRSDVKTLRRLASCDMQLVLPGARANNLFDERWLTTSSMLATKIIGAAPGRTRKDSVNHVARRLAVDLDIRDLNRWSTDERRAFSRIAPIAAAANPASWHASDKRSLRKLLRAKGGEFEATYAQLLGQHAVFRTELGKACRDAEKGRE